MLGLARKGGEQPVQIVEPAVAAPRDGHAARRESLHQISNFLLDHDLAVNPANLVLAQEIVSGSNPALKQQIVARRLAHEPITQAWLDDATSDAAAAADGPDAREREAIDLLVGKVEQFLDRSAQNASEANAATAEYHAALLAIATSLEAARPVVDIPVLTQLTRTMLERTRMVEENMRRREGEAGALREALQMARADAAMDRLTGMDNARSFAAVLEREIHAARQTGQPLSIAFCDIDKFKVINDMHGGDTGDRVIQAVARVLQRISGESCHLARHGGAEFVLLFRGLAPDEAAREIDQARENFAQRKLVDRKTHIAIGSVTFSGGVADALAYDDPQAALQAADAALSQAREAGNRIVVAGVI